MRKVIYTLVLTAGVIACRYAETLAENGNDKAQVNAQKNDTRLIQTAKSAVWATMPDKPDLETRIISIKGRKIPFVSLKNRDVIYPVIIDLNPEVRAVLKQVTTHLPDGNTRVSHYANGLLVGYYIRDPAGKVLMGKGNCALSNESCAGRLYRERKEIIASDGDTQALCDMLGSICDAEIYTAATICCWLDC